MSALRIIAALVAPLVTLLAIVLVGASVGGISLESDGALRTEAFWASATMLFIVPSAMLVPAGRTAVAGVLAIVWMALGALVETTATVFAMLAVSAAISVGYVAHASANHEHLDDWPLVRWVGVPTIAAAYGFGAILMLLGSLSLPVGSNCGRGNVRAVKAAADIRAIEQAVELYRAEHGRFPTSDEGFGVLIDDGCAPTQHEPFLDRSPVDPWGNEYFYESDGQSFRVGTFGSDGLPGGEGLAADLDSNTLRATDSR